MLRIKQILFPTRPDPGALWQTHETLLNTDLHIDQLRVERG
jgi:hypothetical protein